MMPPQTGTMYISCTTRSTGTTIHWTEVIFELTLQCFHHFLPQFHSLPQLFSHPSSESSTSYSLSSSMKVLSNASRKLTFLSLAIIHFRWLEHQHNTIGSSEEFSSLVRRKSSFSLANFHETKSRVHGTRGLFCEQCEHIGEEWGTRSVEGNVLLCSSVLEVFTLCLSVK